MVWLVFNTCGVLHWKLNAVLSSVDSKMQMDTPGQKEFLPSKAIKMGWKRITIAPEESKAVNGLYFSCVYHSALYCHLQTEVQYIDV